MELVVAFAATNACIEVTAVAVNPAAKTEKLDSAGATLAQVKGKLVSVNPPVGEETLLTYKRPDMVTNLPIFVYLI